MKPKIDELKKQLPKNEVREFRGHLELREDGEPTIDLFIPYNSRSVDMGFTELIAPGAFNRSIRNGRNATRRDGDIKALWNHNSDYVLGRQANGTLDFKETQDGMRATVTPAPDEIRWQADALASIRLGLVDGTSFGFETLKDEWEYDDDGKATRTLTEVRLFEVSPVAFPAYGASNAEARSLIDAAMVKQGIDTRELALMLNEVTEGKVPTSHSERLKALITRLQTFIPSDEPVKPEVVEIDWAARLALRERTLKLIA